MKKIIDFSQLTHLFYDKTRSVFFGKWREKVLISVLHRHDMSGEL